MHRSQKNSTAGFSLIAVVVAVFVAVIFTTVTFVRAVNESIDFIPAPFQDDVGNTKKAPSLQLKTLIMITTTPARPSPSPIARKLVDCSTGGGGGLRASIPSHENEVLKAYAPALAHAGEKLNMWAQDEHHMFLGIPTVQIKTPTGLQTKSYPSSPIAGTPDTVFIANPLIGAPYTSAALLEDEAGTDSYGRPVFPSIFLTDITQDPTSQAGDWQNGGTPIAAQSVWGAWLYRTKTVDRTGGGASRISFSAPHDSGAQNGWTFPAGAPTPPPGLRPNDEYGALAQWDIDTMILTGVMQTAHTYRVQFMVHDGDGTQEGGDEGEACGTVQL